MIKQMPVHLLAMFECSKCRRRLTNIGGACDYKDCKEVEEELERKEKIFMDKLCMAKENKVVTIDDVIGSLKRIESGDCSEEVFERVTDALEDLGGIV